MKTTCGICPHRCAIEEGGMGLCNARANMGGEITCLNYGKLTSLALDPIEKKPLRRFFPGSRVLSAGSYGCNLRCPFCQNYEISMAGEEDSDIYFVSPEKLIGMALALRREGNIGIAYTYNEPLISYEYVRDCAALAHKNGLMNVAVTNGYICEEPLKKLLPLMDAMNIDLKAFTEGFYKKIGGDLETVKRTIELAAGACHVEVTTLVIPGENDSFGEMESLSAWLASISADIPLHISRFFPRYKYEGKMATPADTIYALTDIAGKNLKYVYAGNC